MAVVSKIAITEKIHNKKPPLSHICINSQLYCKLKLQCIFEIGLHMSCPWHIIQGEQSGSNLKMEVWGRFQWSIRDWQVPERSIWLCILKTHFNPYNIYGTRILPGTLITGLMIIFLPKCHRILNLRPIYKNPSLTFQDALANKCLRTKL